MKTWTRAAINSVQAQVNEEEDELEHAYDIVPERLDPELQHKVHVLAQDEGTWQFLQENPPSGYIMGMAYSTLIKLVPHTDALGILGIGKMHVLSSEHFSSIVTPHLKNFDRVLDIGAGDGSVTQKMAPYFSEVFTTEVSGSMVTSLQSKGFTCVQTASPFTDPLLSTTHFDCITCFNVLDRCDKPRSLLDGIHGMMDENTIAVLAVVFPFRPFVESLTGQQKPTEKIKIVEKTFEAHVNKFVSTVLTPQNLSVVSISRVPYISQGDSRHRLYTLDNAIFVLKKESKASTVTEDNETISISI
eukprot:TRINITY_DN11858_c0_g1_i1.p1 TRINITY_DN11858_c0_g1~~TRINITY_DN11858_c0_g1_i1.p1  ORF type:complete len:302 (+),score=68.19 TRINITY_DN11858_c0_g1_i1:2-907(+)